MAPVMALFFISLKQLRLIVNRFYPAGEFVDNEPDSDFSRLSGLYLTGRTLNVVKHFLRIEKMKFFR